MQYMGSKRRIAKDILPIMLKEAEKHRVGAWCEPFVGGGNMIDKVPHCYRRIGTDANEHVIEALRTIRDNPSNLPDVVTEEEYKSYRHTPPHPITSRVRFVCSFGGKFESGYAKNADGHNYSEVGRRNAIKQSPHLQGVRLFAADYREMKFTRKPVLIYCDPPYQGTTGYKTVDFDSEAFFKWCEDKAEEGHIVFVSEYNAPSHWEVVFEKEQTCNIDNRVAAVTKTEKLYKVRPKKEAK